MRLLRLATNPQSYLQCFYGARPALAARPYDLQHAALMADGYGWADFWSDALRALGYEATDIIANAEPMQRQWASERRVGFSETNWLFDIAAAQVQSFRPDVLFVNDYVTFTRDFLRHLRKEVPSLRLIVGWCGAPYVDSSVFREYDVTLSCIPEYVTAFRAQACRAYHLHHAFAPRVLQGLDPRQPPTSDILFSGSIVKRDGFHTQREALLLALQRRVSLHLYLYVENPSFRDILLSPARRMAYGAATRLLSMGIPRRALAAIPFLGRAACWSGPPSRPNRVQAALLRRARPPVFGLEMFQRLMQSRIVLNTHIDASSASASNLRLFEATGVGSCLLTDWRDNLPELFEPDKEVLAFRSADECVEKAVYLLQHEERRREIARAGQERTLRHHTFEHRAADLDRIIRKAMP